jgi:hypothetical protein
MYRFPTKTSVRGQLSGKTCFACRGTRMLMTLNVAALRKRMCLGATLAPYSTEAIPERCHKDKSPSCWKSPMGKPQTTIVGMLVAEQQGSPKQSARMPGRSRTCRARKQKRVPGHLAWIADATFWAWRTITSCKSAQCSLIVSTARTSSTSLLKVHVPELLTSCHVLSTK